MKDMENKRAIVNGAQLARFSGKPVSLVGLVDEVHSTSFTLRAADNILVNINLAQPLDEPLEGYVEVHGISEGKSIKASDFIIFSNKTFDVKAHNTLCNLLHSVPDLWKMKN